MNCKRAKQDMALCAGRDLDDCAEQQLRRHLSACPDCRDQWQRIQASTQLLQRTAQSEAPPASEVRLWSGVSAALEQIDRGRSQTPAPSRSPFWVPAVAVAALVLATISMFQTLAPLPDDETAVIRVGPSPPSAFEDSDPKFGPSPDQVQFRLDKDQAPRER